MAETHVVTALVAKRVELSGELAKLDERRTAIKAHIANLDAALRLFCYLIPEMCAEETLPARTNWLLSKLDHRSWRPARAG